MRLLLGIVCFLWVVPSFALHVGLKSDDPKLFKVEMQVETGDFVPKVVSRRGKNYLRFLHGEGIDYSRIGKPELPRVRRLLVVAPNSRYRVKTTLEYDTGFKRVTLYPTQADPLEGKTPPAFETDWAAYRKNTWYGGNGVYLGSLMHVGDFTVLPVTFYPIQYNPRQREVRRVKRFQVELVAEHEHADQIIQSGSFPTLYSLDQVEHMALNAGVLKPFLESHIDTRLLVVAPTALLAHATAVGGLHENLGIKVKYHELKVTPTSASLKTLIQTEYAAEKFDSVLLFGDEKLIPLASSGGYTGDYTYSLLSGNDSLADIGVGRYPVSDTGEATLIFNKLRRHYLSLVNFRNTMLIAHKENYPGKYTANMEEVRNAPNPKNLNFVAQYGGTGSTNESVLEALKEPYGIVVYRGHGSSTAWTGWGKNADYFSTDQVAALPSDSLSSSVYLNIACTNAALQNTAHSLAEMQLFPSTNPEDYRGAVAAVGATTESATETNHRFIKHFFNFLQANRAPGLGAAYAAANNKLVLENGGSAPSNTKMYLLLGDPLLPMAR